MTVFSRFPHDGYMFSAVEVGRALASFVRRGSDGQPVPGVIGSTANLLAAISGTWQVKVRPFSYVWTDAGGVELSGVSASESVDILPAAGNIPVGQARIDRIAWDWENAELVVIDGTPSSSPTPPDPGGLFSLGTVLVNASDGAVFDPQIVVDAAETSLVSNEPRIASGEIAKRNVPRNSGTDVYLTFPAGLFVGAPNVQVTTIAGTRGARTLVVNASETQCQIALINETNAVAQIGAFWRASQE